jgi:hypothetical protein
MCLNWEAVVPPESGFRRNPKAFDPSVPSTPPSPGRDKPAIAHGWVESLTVSVPALSQWYNSEHESKTSTDSRGRSTNTAKHYPPPASGPQEGSTARSEGGVFIGPGPGEDLFIGARELPVPPIPMLSGWPRQGRNQQREQHTQKTELFLDSLRIGRRSTTPVEVCKMPTVHIWQTAGPGETPTEGLQAAGARRILNRKVCLQSAGPVSDV